jgi:hypothetical protein
MTAPLPFTVHAALPCQPHAGFAASLAAELGAFDDAALERGLAALELPVAGLAALGHPVRAGMPVGVVGVGGRHLVGHEHVTPWLLDPVTGEVVDARTLGQEPEWRCGHQVADTLLDEVELRCERAGDLTRAIRAAQLRCALPFDDEASERAGLRLRRLRSRLN